MKIKNLLKSALCATIATVAAVGITGCGGDTGGTTTNTLFLYPINYYGIEGKAFTSRWDGMAGALREAGWEITGDGQKDSQKFKANRKAECTMPEDTQIVFINNQTWDTNLALTDKLLEYQPLAVISTCNGAEFCSERILANSPSTQNATIASISPSYKDAFKDGSMNYMAAKLSTSSVAPIVAAVCKAVRTNERLVDENGDPLHLGQEFWVVDSYDAFVEMENCDILTGDTPTIMKADMDAAIGSYATFKEFAEKKAGTSAGVKELIASHASSKPTDVVETGRKLKIGLLVPQSINDAVKGYLDFMEGYLARVYNYETKRFAVTGSVNQEQAAEQACNDNCDAIISLQDDTNRAAACKKAEDNGKWFAVAGSCVYSESKTYTSGADAGKLNEWGQMAACSRFVGSVGTSLKAEYNAGYNMVKHYIDIINKRGKLN